MFVTNNTKNKKYEQKQAIRGPENVSRETFFVFHGLCNFAFLQFTSLQKIILQIILYCLIISYTKKRLRGPNDRGKSRRNKRTSVEASISSCADRKKGACAR